MKKTASLLLLPLGLAFLLAAPAKVYAQACDVGSAAVARLESEAQNLAVEAVTEALKAAYEASVKAARGVFISQNEASDSGLLKKMDEDIIDKLDWFWQEWRETLKLQTKQLSATMVVQSQQLATNFDAAGIVDSGVLHQTGEIKVRKNFTPTTQACMFDSMAQYLTGGKKVSTSMVRGYSNDFNRVGNATAGTPANGGKATLQKARWETYTEKFCDPKQNNGYAGCTTAQELTNAHVQPSKTLFTKETIDMSNPDTATAVTELLFNITGYDVPDLIPETALSSTAGIEQRLEDRQYIAQMDAVGALAWGVVADRTPGKAAPEIKAIRQKSGVPDALISDRPSRREIRQALIEQLWDPNYYKELFDNPNTISQKELYLKAYGLVMLSDMIEKQEKISAAYAIETANMLDKHDHSRGSVSSSAPTMQKQGE